MLMNKFWELGHSGIVPFFYTGKEDMHKYMQYDSSMTVYMGRAANQKKVPK